MNYDEEILKLGYNSVYNDKDAPFILTYLSDKTFTGRNAFWLKNSVKEGKIALKGISDLANKDLFPDIYNNNRITTKEIHMLENMRYSELEMLLEGKYPQHEEKYVFGYSISGVSGKTYCGKNETNTPGLNFVFTYSEMIEKFKDLDNDYPYALWNEVKKIADLGIRIRNY